MSRADRAQRFAAKAAGNPLTWLLIIGLMFSWPIVRSIQAASELPDSRPLLGSLPGFAAALILIGLVAALAATAFGSTIVAYYVFRTAGPES